MILIFARIRARGEEAPGILGAAAVGAAGWRL